MPPRLRQPPSGPLPGVRLLAWDGPLYRIQNAAALDYRTYPSARYRFDAPAGQYPILYTNDSQVGVFAEVYTDRGRRLGSEDADRHLVKLVPTSPLPLVDLLSDGTLKDFELDERVSTGDDYERCQQWALKIHEECPGAMGIRYGARCAGRRTSNVALFAKRCEKELDLESMGRLKDLEEVVLAATDRYGLRASFLVL